MAATKTDLTAEPQRAQRSSLGAHASSVPCVFDTTHAGCVRSQEDAEKYPFQAAKDFRVSNTDGHRSRTTNGNLSLTATVAQDFLQHARLTLGEFRIVVSGICSGCNFDERLFRRPVVELSPKTVFEDFSEQPVYSDEGEDARPPLHKKRTLNERREPEFCRV